MPIELSDFELAVFFCWLITSLALILGMAVVYQVKHRLSPLGRLAPQRWFGV
jgi:hypothetical protein